MMRKPISRKLWTVIGVFMTALVAHGEPVEEPRKSRDRIDSLIKQLGADKFSQREAAGKELEAIGDAALLALKRAAAASDDLEVKRRAHELVRAILQGMRKSKSTKMELVLVDSGEMHMGSRKNETGRKLDETEHEVSITQPFLMGAYEVTQEEYQQVMKTNPSWFSGTGAGKEKVAKIDTKRFPVENVTWFDAIEFCNQLSKLDGYEPYYKITDVKRDKDSITSASVLVSGGHGYRLPTEAEWEYACRARTVAMYNFGQFTNGSQANFKAYASSGGYGAPSRLVHVGLTSKVGSYKPNAWGLHDMHGNVAEWCWDWYDKDYYTNSPKVDPAGPEKGQHRAMRGGSWMIGNENCRSASRFWLAPAERKEYAGFRVARTP